MERSGRNCVSWRVSALVVLAFAGLPSCGGGGGGDPDGDSVARAAVLTKEAVTGLVTGDDDFASLSAKLREATTLDPANEAARLFLPISDWLGFLDTTSSGGGTFQDLFQRAGYVNPNAGGSFWDFDLQETDHGQGQVKDGAPDADELKTFLTSQYLPQLLGLTNALGTAGTAFTYSIDSTVGGRFFDDLAPEDRITYELDYGDLTALRAGLLAHAAVLQALAAYDWDELQPNDFDDGDLPGVRPLDVIDASYPGLGTVENASLLTSARQRAEESWQAYALASAHVRGESVARQEVGILTLGRDVFPTEQDRQDFLDRESAFRTQGQAIVANFTVDAPLVVTVGPDGSALDPNQRPAINFFQLFQGKDLHALYFATVIDPIANQRVLGTSDFGLLSPSMWTLGGVLSSYGGIAPTAGDLQVLGYAVRLDAPPADAKTIDGAFGDWQPGVNAAQLAAPPGVTSLLPSLGDVIPDAGDAKDVPDVGNVYASVAGASLYLHLDRDVTPYVVGFFDSYEIRVDGPAGSAAVTYWPFGGHASWATDPSLDPVFAFTPGAGIEVHFPTGVGGTGEHARVTVRVTGQNAGAPFESVREDLIVKVR